jgi:LacI family transcriptional regulator
MEQAKKIVLMTWPTAAGIRGWSRYPGSPRWRFEVLPPNGQALRALEAEPPDGMIAYLGSPAFADWAARQPFPVVNHSSALETSPVPRVCLDDRAAGSLAAECLLDLGHEHLAYVGYEAPFFSAERQAGFRGRAGEAGIEPAVFLVHTALTPATRQQSAGLHREMANFLAGLPKPAGVFACNDPLGLWVIDAAADAGRMVPEDTAVLGMDNDPLCLLSSPPLSSIDSPFEPAAYEAAAMLDRMLRGKTIKKRDVRIAPRQVLARQSTDMLAIDDAATGAAVRYLREHFAEPLHVDDLARAVHVSRRVLEKRFRRKLGRTPLQELQRLRLQAAKRLLVDTRLGLEEVAARAGFESRQWFSAVFRRQVGETPDRFRRRSR